MEGLFQIKLNSPNARPLELYSLNYRLLLNRPVVVIMIIPEIFYSNIDIDLHFNLPPIRFFVFISSHSKNKHTIGISNIYTLTHYKYNPKIFSSNVACNLLVVYFKYSIVIKMLFVVSIFENVD